MLELRAQAARQLDEQQRNGDAWRDTGLVFAKEDGGAIHPEVASRFFRQAVRRAMLLEIRLRELRHTHATLALRAGIHPKVVSERLGHATVSITLDAFSQGGCDAEGGGRDDRDACHRTVEEATVRRMRTACGQRTPRPLAVKVKLAGKSGVAA